jgi:hypothetical protein
MKQKPKTKIHDEVYYPKWMKHGSCMKSTTKMSLVIWVKLFLWMNFDNMDEIELEIDLKGKNQHI